MKNKKVVDMGYVCGEVTVELFVNMNTMLNNGFEVFKTDVSWRVIDGIYTPAILVIFVKYEDVEAKADNHE